MIKKIIVIIITTFTLVSNLHAGSDGELLLKKNKPSEIKYSPWFFLGFLSFFSALLIWETGVPDHPWCNPDSWLQAHMIWHLLCSAATFSFFKLYRSEKYLN